MPSQHHQQLAHMRNDGHNHPSLCGSLGQKSEWEQSLGGQSLDRELGTGAALLSVRKFKRRRVPTSVRPRSMSKSMASLQISGMVLVWVGKKFSCSWCLADWMWRSICVLGHHRGRDDRYKLDGCTCHSSSQTVHVGCQQYWRHGRLTWWVQIQRHEWWRCFNPGRSLKDCAGDKVEGNQAVFVSKLQARLKFKFLKFIVNNINSKLNSWLKPCQSAQWQPVFHWSDWPCR